MAGRPRTMAKRVGVLEEQAFCLALELFRTWPRMYENRRSSSDPLGKAWRHAVEDSILASVRIMMLGHRLREKAKIEDPGPAEEHFWELFDNDQELDFVAMYDDVRLDVIHGFLPM